MQIVGAMLPLRAGCAWRRRPLLLPGAVVFRIYAETESLLE
jgi:hypothetical protein